MPCFCDQPLLNRTQDFVPDFGLALPPPLTMQVALAFPSLLDEAQRLDVMMNAEIANFAMPNVSMPTGGLMNIALMFTMLPGNFTLPNLPMFEMQMQQAADSLHRNVWPNLRNLVRMPIMPLLNYALVARLVLDLTEMGIDPFVMDMPRPPRVHRPTFKFALSKPRLVMARFFAGLPRLLNLPLALDLPPFGEPGAGATMANRLGHYAALTPPNLVLPIPQLMRLAMVLEAIATIEEAFGTDWMASNKRSLINSMLRRWSGFPMPIPYPMNLLSLQQKLDALPPIEDVRLGMEMASAMSPGAWRNMTFAPPKLLIAPFLNMVLGLAASLQFRLDMEPFDLCDMCPCS